MRSAAAAGAGYALGRAGRRRSLILIPAYHAGSRYGRFGFLLTCVVASAAFLVSVWLCPPDRGQPPGLIAWIGAAITLGVLGAWNKRLSRRAGARTSTPPRARRSS